MSFAAQVMRRTARRLAMIQLVMTVLVAGVTVLISGLSSDLDSALNLGLAALYGGLVTVSGTLLMAWRIRRAGEMGQRSKHQGYVEVYTGAVQKFILTLVLLGVGMGVIKLHPLAIIVGFAFTQLSYLANKVDTSRQ